MLIPVEHTESKASLSISPPSSTGYMTEIPEIEDIGFLDTPQHVDAFRDELKRCASMGIDVALSAVHQILSRMADRQSGGLCMRDVDAALSAIQRAR